MAQILLITGGVLSFAVAVLHMAIIYSGAPGYRYFGAGEKMATMAEQGSKVPALVTTCVTIGFVGFGIYALAAAGIVGGLPLVFWGALGVSAIYTLRGLGLFAMFAMPGMVSRFDIVSSLVSLAIGLIHFGGLFWDRLAIP